MEEKIKAILSRFIKIPVEQINASTVIDRSAVTGSILLHRMYAALATEGFAVENYWDIKNYGTLLQRINGVATQQSIQVVSSEINIDKYTEAPGTGFKGIGIDIEHISAMPVANDFREEAFYKMNFTPTEIAYCILQPNALASFAGLFAAKEAIVKANNAYKEKPFNAIFIDHLPNGKPVHAGFQISISHTGELAVAIAEYTSANPTPVEFLTGNIKALSTTKKSYLPLMLALLAFLLSVATLLIILFKH